MCEVPCTLHTMLHLEESGNKEQRKAGGFNYDILGELLGLERTKQPGNFVAAFVSAADDSRWPADSPG